MKIFTFGFLAAAMTICVDAGELTQRMNLTLERVLRGGPPLYTDDFVLADAVPQHVRLYTEFSGDVSGRYLGSLAVVSQFNGSQIPELDRIFSRLKSLQKIDGHFGDPFGTDSVNNADMALLWGNGRMLIGLLEYHRLRPQSEVLTCARRLGDFLVASAPRFNDPMVRQQFSGEQVAVGYICWTQIIEGLVALHLATNDEKYLILAKQIAENTQRYPRQHSHGFVTTLRGILELYRATQDQHWLRKVEVEWEGVVSSGNLLPQGALPEVFKPLMPIPNDEGCSEADWLRLNLGLWSETRNLRYLENAELTLFNEFFGNQFHTGDFGHRTFSDAGYAPGGTRAWWCCTFHGLRAFPDIQRSAFHSEPTRLCYDLPVDGQFADAEWIVQADSTLGRNAKATLTVAKASGKEQTLSVRQPAWASSVQLKLNGRVLEGVRQEGAVAVRRRWRTGDRIEVQYVLRTRLMNHPQHTGRFAVLRGPWFLGVDEQNSPTFVDEPRSKTRVARPRSDANGDVQLVPVVGKKADGKVAFTAPAAHLSLPYLPGGYPTQPQTVTLRPMAEHTSVADSTQWVLWFHEKE